MFSSTKRALSAAFASGLAVGIVGTGIAATGGSVKFSDVPAGSYFDQAVGTLVDRGIIKGNPDGTYNPGGNVTRADLAVVLHRLLVSIGEEDPIVGTVTSRRSSRASADASSSSSEASTTSVGSSPNGTIRFATPSATIIENASQGGINVAIVRTGGNTGAVGITLTTADGTGKVTEDYQAVTTTVTFAQGETSKVVKLSLVDDTASEGTETILLNLASPTGGALLGTPSQMTINVTDNELPSSGASSSASSAVAGAGKFTLSAAGYGPAENGGPITVTVLRTDGSTGNVAVNYSTSNGTAISGTDYGPVSSTLNFASGETSKTFTVEVYDNSAIDGNRNFTISLSNPTGGSALGDAPTATAMIYDNETLAYGTGSLKFSKSNYLVTEASGVALVTISRVGGAKGQVKVNYAATNGTAIAADFTPVSGTMTFEKGETAKIFRVTILRDEIADSDETISLQLSSPTNGAQTIDPTFAVITIQ